MKNCEKYHFSDFTRDNYRRLLRLAQNTYADRGFLNFRESERFILWRHDIDFSPHSARKIAIIESEEGIRATYFLLLHSTFYNLLEKNVTDCVRDIVFRGHYIGLHFDPQYYDLACERDLEQKLLFEKIVLEDIFNVSIGVFSFHISTPFALECNQYQYGGLVNATADFFRSRVGYCSDSNGYWRFRRLENVLQEAVENSLQILTHPEMWQDEVMSPKERVLRCINGRAENTRRWYEAIYKQYRRSNVDWE